MDKTYEIQICPTYIHIHLTSAFDLVRDIEAYTKDVLKILDNLPAPLTMLVVIDNFSVALDDLTYAANYATRGGGTAYLTHPNMKEFLVVTSSKAIAFAVRGIGSPIFGGIKSKTFTNVDDALAYIHQ